MTSRNVFVTSRIIGIDFQEDSNDDDKDDDDEISDFDLDDDDIDDDEDISGGPQPLVLLIRSGCKIEIQ